MFTNNCAGIIPASAVRYVNDSYHQYLQYDNIRTAFIFNHCYNLSLNNLISYQDPSDFGIIGVNLCGDSNISITNSVGVPEMKTLLY